MTKATSREPNKRGRKKGAVHQKVNDEQPKVKVEEVVTPKDIEGDKKDTKDMAEVEKRIEEVITKVIESETQEIEEEAKRLLEAVKATGKVTFEERRIKETLATAEDLKRVNFDKINFVINPRRAIVTIANGLSIPPYTIVYLPRTVGDKKRLDALRKSPRFINAIRSRLIIGFEDLTPQDFAKLRKALMTEANKGLNVLEMAERKGISGATDLKVLIQRDKEIEEYFKKMLEDIRHKTGTDKINMGLTGQVI